MLIDHGCKISKQVRGKEWIEDQGAMSELGLLPFRSLNSLDQSFNVVGTMGR